MKKIPLHSLILLIDDHFSNINLDFKDHEVLSLSKISNQIYGLEKINDLVEARYYDLIETKIKYGERVIIDGTNLNYRIREKITYYGKKYRIPIFYLISKEETLHDKQILNGDNRAEIIKLFENQEIRIVHKNQINLKYLTNNGYAGLTIIPDVHNMSNSLKNAVEWAKQRKHYIIQLGDLIDYGPNPLECIDVMYDLITRGHASAIIGNHEKKVIRYFTNETNDRIRLSNANKTTIDAINSLHYDLKRVYVSKLLTINNLSHNILNIENLYFTHGAIHPSFWINQTLTREILEYAYYGEVEANREQVTRIYNWVNDIPKDQIVIVGHDIRSTSLPINIDNTNNGKAIFLDTGSGKSGTLTTLDLPIRKNKIEFGNFNRY